MLLYYVFSIEKADAYAIEKDSNYIIYHGTMLVKLLFFLLIHHYQLHNLLI